MVLSNSTIPVLAGYLVMAASSALLSDSAKSCLVRSSPRKDQEAPSCQPTLLNGEALSGDLQWYAPPRRPYSRGELLADRSINFLGAGLSWLACLLLGYSSWAADDSPMKQGFFWLHGIGLIIMLNCSALYHYWAWDWSNSNKLLSLDHIGISAMITGCYAPVMAQCGCYYVFAFVCLLGVAVVPMELLRLSQVSQNASSDEPTKNWSCVDIMHIVRYLIMGWSCIIVGPSLLRALPSAALSAMVAGGVVYTSGVFFFVSHGIKYHLAIWHGFVVLASACFYLANLLVLVGRPLSTAS